jgi:hypothetical protein
MRANSIDPATGELCVVAIDASGFWWRAFEGEYWSMPPTNPDNSPIPQPVRLFRLVPIGPEQEGG